MVGVVIVLETIMLATLIKLVKFAAVVVNDPVTTRSPVSVAPFPFPKVFRFKHTKCEIRVCVGSDS